MQGPHGLVGSKLAGHVWNILQQRGQVAREQAPGAACLADGSSSIQHIGIDSSLYTTMDSVEDSELHLEGKGEGVLLAGLSPIAYLPGLCLFCIR